MGSPSLTALGREEGGHGGTAGLPVLVARSWCVGGGRRVLQLWPNLARRPRAAFGCGRVCYNGGLTGHEARDWQEPRQGYGDDRRRDHDGVSFKANDVFSVARRGWPASDLRPNVAIDCVKPEEVGTHTLSRCRRSSCAWISYFSWYFPIAPRASYYMHVSKINDVKLE